VNVASGHTALLLVDLQHDFLDRVGLEPSAPALVARVAELLGGFRAVGAPVAHIRTRTRADGSDAMPHWRANDAVACVDGTPGAEPPAALREVAGELVVFKQHYRGFADPALDGWLRDRDVSAVVIAGVYTHACVRETALDAYERGYRVTIASDAVGSPEPVHAAETRRWLATRAAEFQPVAAVLADHGAARVRQAVVPHYDPCRSDRLLHEVVVDTVADVHTAVETVAGALPAWQARSVPERAQALDAWADRLQAASDALADAIVEEVAKPRAAAEDEVRRAIAHVRTAAALLRDLDGAPRALAEGVAVRSRPVGVVGILMPWNNPLALPVGKIAPALAFGNGVVFKPAPEGTATARAFLDECAAAGLPGELLALVTGDARTGAAVADDPGIAALAITGSIGAGRAVAMRCAATGKSLQAELGGNNAAIVWDDDDLVAHVPALARAAYSYSGQRCTAIRRFVVRESEVDGFTALLADVIGALVVGEPSDRATDIGPLISRAARERVAAVVDRARDAGADVVCGGEVPTSLAHGAWYQPTLLVTKDRECEVVQEETFGPVAVVQPAADLDDALAAANGVEQGLVMAVCSTDPAVRARVRDAAEAGIVHLGAGPVPVHADAPFGGWKGSGFGPPEHGEWDAWFATRLQAVYGDW
jgi:aldehyde dehydrogenase (NAD+)